MNKKSQEFWVQECRSCQIIWYITEERWASEYQHISQSCNQKSMLQ